MKVLLVGINAKFIQSNLAIRVLSCYTKAHSVAVASGKATVEYAEWNINQTDETLVRGIFERAADVVLFSVYIWNQTTVFKVISCLSKIMPHAFFGCGGPEVSWAVEKTFQKNSALSFIFSGEGEESFTEFLDSFSVSFPEIDTLKIPGLSLRIKDDEHCEGIYSPGVRKVLSNLDGIPFPYRNPEYSFDTSVRIVYYESSRGCPYKCAYCLSSIEPSVRYYSLPRVFSDLDFFLEQGIPLVKFVDRTFNLDPERYLAIWKYIRDHYNGITTFHFEISAEHLPDEAFVIMESMPPGSIQFEIGIQSIHSETLRRVHRPGNSEKLAEKIKKIPKEIHVHVDLIAGLPGETLEDCALSFNYAWEFHAGMLQLGFLKILEGSHMMEIAQSEQGYLWQDYPPYEVLSTPNLTPSDLYILKDVEHLVDSWFNSGILRNSLIKLISSTGSASAFDHFIRLTEHVRGFFADGDLFLPRRPADIFECFACFQDCTEEIKEYLKLDFLLQGKPGAYPGWFKRNSSKEGYERALVSCGLFSEERVPRRTIYAVTEFEVLAIEDIAKPQGYLFLYEKGKKHEKKAHFVSV